MLNKEDKSSESGRYLKHEPCIVIETFKWSFVSSVNKQWPNCAVRTTVPVLVVLKKTLRKGLRSFRAVTVVVYLLGVLEDACGFGNVIREGQGD